MTTDPMALMYEKMIAPSTVRKEVLEQLNTLEKQNNNEGIKFYIDNVLNEQEIEFLIKQKFGHNITRVSTVLKKIQASIQELKNKPLNP